MSEAPLKSRILRESRAVLTYPNGAEGVESDDGYCEMASSVRSAGRARTGEAGLKTRPRAADRERVLPADCERRERQR